MDICFLKNIKGKATHRTLVAAIVEAIDSGLLVGGERLPSSREIALYVNSCRTTVVRAFDELIARGYLTGIKGSGTVVSQKHKRFKTESFDPRACQPFGWSERYNALADSVSARAFAESKRAGEAPIEISQPRADQLPMREWRKILHALLDGSNYRECGHDLDSFGYMPLRQAISDYLRRTSGVCCPPERMIVYSGSDNFLADLLCLLVKEGDAVICEDPAPKTTVQLFAGHGASMRTVPADSGGLCVDQLQNIIQAPHWLYTSTSTNNPLGHTLQDNRRRDLLHWAQASNVAIIEDGTGSEFHYGSAESQTLFSMDRRGAVIYACDFSSILAPLTRIGILLLPEKLVPIFRDFRSLKHAPDAAVTVEQRLIAQLFADGHIEKHLRAAWKTLRRRRSRLILELKSAFKDKVEIMAPETGTTIMARFTRSVPQEDMEQALKEALLPAVPISRRYACSKESDLYVFDFAAMDENETSARVLRLSSIIASWSRETVDRSMAILQPQTSQLMFG